MKIVTLKLYKGKETYNKEGELTSENQLYKVSYNTFDWEKFKKTIGLTFSNAEVVDFNEQIVKIEEEEVLGKKTPVSKFSYKKLEITEELKKEVDIIFKGEEAELTSDQKKIADLQRKLDELLSKSNSKSATKPKKKEGSQDDSNIEDLKSEYEKLSDGKKAHHMWKEETLKAKIAELK